MARKVTRTIKSTQVEALVVNVLTKEVMTVNTTVAGAYTTEKDLKELLESLRTVYDTSSNKVAAITSTATIEELRVMSEDDFIKYSVTAKSKSESEEN